jgi:hypothetical protein
VLTGARRSIILFAVACCGLLAQDAGAFSTEVSLQPTRDPETGAPTASLSVVQGDIGWHDGVRIDIKAQTLINGVRTPFRRVARVRVNPKKNKGPVTIRFRNLRTKSSGKIEKVIFQVYCIDSEGVKTGSENNASTLNKFKGGRFVHDLDLLPII